MISNFLSPSGPLRVLDNITDQELLANIAWPKGSDGRPLRDAVEYMEYGKDNYWTEERMVEQTIRLALPIFRYAFPGCQGLFAFDNASNHCCFAPDALIVSKINQNPGGSQPLMRDGFIHSKQLPQSMVFSQNHVISRLRGKAKGIEQIL